MKTIGRWMRDKKVLYVFDWRLDPFNKVYTQAISNIPEKYFSDMKKYYIYWCLYN